MLVREHEGKLLLAEAGIPVPSGRIVQSVDELELIRDEIQFPVALKAQIPAGKRGLGGGICFADTFDKAQDEARRLLGGRVNGHLVSSILVEPKVAIRAERYLGLAVAMNDVWLMIGRTGGIDIEATAAADPASVAHIPLRRCVDGTTTEILGAFRELAFPEHLWDGYLDSCRRLERVFCGSDALMAEINPLVETFDDRLVALDARIEADDSALARQPRLREFLGLSASDDGWGKATKISRLNVESGDGAIGLIGLGGGMALAVSDWLAAEGAGLAGAIDMDSSLSAGVSRETLAKTFDAFDLDPRVRVVLVNLISSGNRIDNIAKEFLPVLADKCRTFRSPVVVHLQGNGGVAATETLARAGIHNCSGLREAMETALGHLKGAA